MSLHSDAVRTLTNWHPSSQPQRRLQQSYLKHLNEHPDALSRDCHPDHLTASALVVSHDRAKVLLNLHAKYQVWMQFGGHCEPSDATMAKAALRESIEESGIAGLRLLSEMPVQLDTHEVQCGPESPAHHLDVRYIAAAPAGAEGKASEESIEVRWFDRHDLPAGLEPEIRDLIEKSRWV